jgi:hypothetical protein
MQGLAWLGFAVGVVLTAGSDAPPAYARLMTCANT